MAVLGLGLAALGRPGYMTLGHAADFPSTEVEAMRAQAFAVLDEAWRLGVRHVDTARSYGRAEHFLAEWLEARGLQPGALAITSKWGYRYTAAWQTTAAVHEVKDHSAAHLDAQWAETRALLGPFLTGYQIHSANFESGVLGDDAVLDRLATLRDSGVPVGLSVTGARQPDLIDAAMAITRGGRPLFQVVQATWNVLEPSAGPALARARAAGALTIAKEGLANARLTTRGDAPEWLSFCAREGLAPDAAALAVALAQPFLDVVLSGAATVEQLKSNATARQLDGAALPVASFAEPPQAYWARRARLPWT